MSATAEFMGGPADGLTMDCPHEGPPPEYRLPLRPPWPQMVPPPDAALLALPVDVVLYRRRPDPDPHSERYYLDYVPERSS